MMLKLLRKIFSKLNYLFFVGSTDILPEPFNKEEEEKYVNMFLNGDMTARDKLIEHNLRLVVFLAKKYENTKIDLEDLVSIGTIGLIKGVNTYQNDKNIKLATYASRCIENEILMYLRKKSKSRGEVSLDEPLKCDYDGNELLLVDILSESENEVLDNLFVKEQNNMLHQAIDTLKPREKETLSLRFGLNGYDELTQKEAAEKLGISQSYISRLEKRIIKKLKNNLKENMKV